MSKPVKPPKAEHPVESPVYFCPNCGSNWLKSRGPECIECNPKATSQKVA